MQGKQPVIKIKDKRKINGSLLKNKKDKINTLASCKAIIIMKNMKRYPIKYLLLIQTKTEQYDFSKEQNLLNIVLKNQSQKISEILNSQKYVSNKNRDNRRKIAKEDFGKKKQRKIQRDKNRHKPNLPRLVYFKPLKQSLNSWKAQHNKNVRHEEKMKRSTIILLNKLSIENIDKLCPLFVQKILKRCEKVIDVNIIVKTIFEKACDETNFSILYARLCDYAQKNTINEYFIKKEKNNDIIKKNKTTDIRTIFKRVIINLCQSNFYNKNSKKEDEVRQLRKKKKILGNIKFIGDLFKEKLIHESIIHHIIWNFLKPNKNSSQNTQTLGLEGCVKFFQTIGMELDTKNNKRWIDQYFSYLEHYSKKNGSARIRFMVMDLFELRENKWRNKIQTDAIKTKKEVAAEFEELQQTKICEYKKSTSRRDSKTFQNGLGACSKKNVEFYKSSKMQNTSINTKKKYQKNLKLQFESCFQKKEKDGRRCFKKIDAENAQKFLFSGKIENLEIYVQYMITDARTDVFNQMLILLRKNIRTKNTFSHTSLKNWAIELSKNIVGIQLEYDIPNGSKIFGKIIAEFFSIKKMNIEDVIMYAKAFDRKNTKFRNEFMVEILEQSLKLTSMKSQGEADNLLTTFKQKIDLIKSGFEFHPTLFNKPSQFSGVPPPEECSLLSNLLGEQYENLFITSKQKD